MLDHNSLLDEIRRLHEERQTGTLALSANGERVDMFFREGMIEAVSSNLGSRRLGDYLVKEGVIPAHDLNAVEAEAQRRKIAFGEAAVRKNLVDQAQVGAAARSQALELIDHVLQNGFSVDSFTNCLRSYYAPARVSFPHVLLELSRSNHALYEPQPGSQIALQEGVNLSAFPWFPQELGVLNELNNSNTFHGLLTSTGLTDANLKRALGVFERLGIITTLDSPESGSAVIRRPEFAFEHLIPLVTGAVLDEKLEVARNGNSFAAEQFRNLKVQLSGIDSATPIRVLAVSSADAQDGKSFVSTNLAFSFARDTGRRVIIVDCDLRSPSLGKYLGVAAEPGLLQYLSNSRLSPYCYVRRIENLYFLTTGGVAPNPIEILSMQRMRQLIEYLKKDFDTIILDAPPCGPIADARLVTGLSDGLIMVVRRGKTTYRSSDQAFKVIDRKKLLGVIFNDVKPTLFNRYYHLDYYTYGNRRQVSPAKPQTQPQNYLEPRR